MAKRISKKSPKPPPGLDAPLSPEADKFLAEATEEFNAKQEALDRNWHFDKYKQWGFEQLSGVFRLEFEDGTEFHADGQILGSYSAANNSWEWAWHNPYVDSSISRESRKVKEVGQRLGLSYTEAGMVPVPGEEFVSYLCAIGLKATGALGVFRGAAGPIEVIILLKNPRKVKKAAKTSKKKAA
jgi:hypothetical protein